MKKECIHARHKTFSRKSRGTVPSRSAKIHERVLNFVKNSSRLLPSFFGKKYIFILLVGRFMNFSVINFEWKQLEGSKEQFYLFKNSRIWAQNCQKKSAARKNSYLSEKKSSPSSAFHVSCSNTNGCFWQTFQHFYPASILFINLIVFLPTYFHPAPLFANLGRANIVIHYSTVLNFIFLECGLCEQKWKKIFLFSKGKENFFCFILEYYKLLLNFFFFDRKLRNRSFCTHRILDFCKHRGIMHRGAVLPVFCYRCLGFLSNKIGQLPNPEIV